MSLKSVWEKSLLCEGGFMETNLKALRKKQRLTQIALQMHTGIDQALLSKFESGKRLPTTEALLILSDFYNVSIDYILKRTEKPEVNR